MSLFYKLYNALYIAYLRIFYFKRFVLKGRISSNGFFTIELAKGARLIIIGNITLSRGTLVAVRKNSIVQIGQGCFFNRQCSIVSRKSIVIGENTLVGENVKIYDNDHKIINGTVSKNEYSTEPIVIGEGCWLANDVHILKGSVLPCNTVIAAKGLVNRVLSVSGIYAGIPAVYKKSLN